MTTFGRLAALTLPFLTLSCAPAPAPEPTADFDPAGSWRGALQSPGGELPFQIDIDGAPGSGWTASIRNGEEVVETSGVTVEGRTITLGFDWYDSRIEARAETADRLIGEWTKTAADGISRLDFEATRGVDYRFRPAADTTTADAVPDVGGVWKVEFRDPSGTEPARGEFRQEGERVLGTFLTPTGDYRYLEGSYRNGLLRLSTFDGAHAFLFHARAGSEGTLEGDFWSRDSYHATWTAERAADDDEILPDPWELAGLTNDEGAFRFAFEDLDGNPVASDDPRFDDKVVLVNIFGSWCPNCNDKAPLLAEWFRRYRERGLEIVGLAYEYSGDPQRDREFVRRFAERHGIEFPLLLAGTSDKQQAAGTLPDLTAVIAFPTTVFIGRDGTVRQVHSGFAGPGTGDHYEALVAELEERIESLLAESG